jgi:hypothetical protein
MCEGGELHRYGGMEDLLRLCCEHDELRTLRRTLAAGGARGRSALEQLCRRLSQSQATPGSEDRAASSVVGLRLDVRLQFVYRCHLAMQRPDEAGARRSCGLSFSQFLLASSSDQRDVTC